MDLDYDHLQVTPSNEVRGFDNYMKVVRWWLGNINPATTSGSKPQSVTYQTGNLVN